MNSISGNRIFIVAIFGPTAVGKSRIAVDVARSLDGEIVSADSMQLYAGLPVLTDQPDAELLGVVPHHLVGVIPPDTEYSTGLYAKEAGEIIRDIDGRRKLPLVVGGTGLYIRALLGGLSFAGKGDREARNKWEELINEQGAASAMVQLKKLDREAAAAIDSRNHRRLIRALEAAEAKEPHESFERDRLWSSDSPYRVLCIGLVQSRDELYGRIDKRVDSMLKGGVIDEVDKARRMTVSRTVEQAIGFKDICEYLDGRSSLEETAAAIKQKSRRYAKRQLTWMRKMPDIVRIDLAGRPASAAIEEIIGLIGSHRHNQSTDGY
ncbi:MAG: tRNA (adenosine(37)-N6)-dimethylallyltransferase MiaA [Thermoleophilia bacterium]|jgi:tRNA dimethylallyltransferase